MSDNPTQPGNSVFGDPAGPPTQPAGSPTGATGATGPGPDPTQVGGAVTPAGGIWVFLVIVLVLYTAVFATLARVLLRMAARWRGEGADLAEHDVPYGPQPSLDQVVADRTGEQASVGSDVEARS